MNGNRLGVKVDMLYKRAEEMNDVRKVEMASISENMDQAWGIMEQRMVIMEKSMETLNNALGRVNSIAERQSGAEGKEGSTPTKKWHRAYGSALLSWSNWTSGLLESESVSK